MRHCRVHRACLSLYGETVLIGLIQKQWNLECGPPRLHRLETLEPWPDHPCGWWGWSLRARTARYNENLQSRTTLGPEISREKICGLLKFLPQRGPGPQGPAVAFMPQGPRDHDPALAIGKQISSADWSYLPQWAQHCRYLCSWFLAKLCLYLHHWRAAS